MVNSKPLITALLASSLYLMCTSVGECASRSFEYRNALQTKSSVISTAIGSLKRAAKGKLSNDVVHFSIGILYWAEGQKAAAQREIQKALDLNPSRSEYYLVLGGLLYRHGNMEESQKLLELAIQKKPPLVQSFNTLALLYSKTRQFSKSREVLEKAKTLFPNESSIFFNQGINYGVLKDYDNAVVNLQIAHKLTPLDEEFSFYLGFMQLGQKKYNVARKTFEQLLKRNPDHVDALLGISMTYFAQKQFPQAINLAIEAQKLDPQNQEIAKEIRTYKKAFQYWEETHKSKM